MAVLNKGQSALLSRFKNYEANHWTTEGSRRHRIALQLEDLGLIKSCGYGINCAAWKVTQAGWKTV